MSDLIEIDYEIEYLSCELADEHIESKPVVTTYFDAHFIRSEAEGGVITTHLDEHDLSKVYEGTLKARTPSGVGIPITSAIGFTSYSQQRNDFGMACMVEAGSGHVTMSEITSGMTKTGVFEKRIPLVIETTKLIGEPVRKGEILFRAKEVRKGNRVSFIPLDRCILGDEHTSQSNAEMISQFIQRRVEREASMKDTWDGIHNVRAPMDISSSGIELTKTCFVPIEGFAICETIEVNVEYFQNAFTRTMIRKGSTNPSVDFRALDTPHKAEVLAEIVVYASQSFDYISDTFVLSKRDPSGGVSEPMRRIPGEKFADILSTASGDCEDGGKGAIVMFYNFLRLKIDPIKFPELAELQRIARNYVGFLTLATVHGARVNDGVEKVGAHMYGLLIPKDQVRSILSTTPDGKMWANRLPLEQTIDLLPTLILEGTGRFRPMGSGPIELHSLKTVNVGNLIRSALIGEAPASHPASYDPLHSERQYVGHYLDSKGFKVLIEYTWGRNSSFYLGNLALITNHFMDIGENLGAFICGKIDREKGIITRGSKFTDLIRQENTVALIPCEPLPEKIMEITREAAALRAPTRSFVLDESKIDPALKVNAELERLKSAVKAMGRTGNSPFGPVGVYARPHQFNKQRIDNMIQNISQMKAVYKVDYQFEAITTSMCQYRIMVYVDKTLI